MRRIPWLVGAFLALALAACSALPWPASIDLKERLGNDSEGSLEHEVTAGEVGDLDDRFPSDAGECVDLSDVRSRARVQRAQLHYNVDLTYDGPDLTGMVQAQLYAAGDRDALWQERNKVGPTVTMQLRREQTRLAGTVVLNRDQLRALNDRRICWGVHVTGRDVSAQESGTMRVDYVVNQLRLNIGVSILSSGG